MTILEFKSALGKMDQVVFELPDGKKVPAHFHVTEVGKISKDFIDCGGTVRNEKVASMQLWQAEDFQHRLKADKLVGIIQKSEEVLGMENLPIEVEYQGSTIGKYGVKLNHDKFVLTIKETDCLAKDNCGIPIVKEMVNLAGESENCCTPGGGCC